MRLFHYFTHYITRNAGNGNDKFYTKLVAACAVRE